jgi:hypothetical protein
VLNDRYWQHARDNLSDDSNLIRLYDVVNEGLTYKPSPEELADFKLFDERHALARVAYSDRHLQNYTHEELVGLYVYLLNVFNNYIDMVRPTVFVFNTVASQVAHLFYLALVERGVDVIIPFFFGIDQLIYLGDNPYLNSKDIWETHSRYKQGLEDPPSEAVQWAKQIMGRIRQQRGAYEIGHLLKVEGHRFRFPSPIAAARYVYNHFRHYRSDPNLPGIWGRISEVILVRWNRFRSRRFFVPYQNVLKSDFLFFPLHYEPEIATLVISQYDQLSVIDIVARQLPIGWKMVIKDHPVMIGQRSADFFRQILKRYPNVVVVDPSVNAQRLIQASRAVLTLNGTVALEALVLAKPIIITSATRFGGFGIGTFSQDLLNFGSVLKGALEKKHDDADLMLMLASIWRHCDKFEFTEPLGRPSVLAEQNIRHIADAILRKMADNAAQVSS